MARNYSRTKRKYLLASSGYSSILLLLHILEIKRCLDFPRFEVDFKTSLCAGWTASGQFTWNRKAVIRFAAHLWDIDRPKVVWSGAAKYPLKTTISRASVIFTFSFSPWYFSRRSCSVSSLPWHPFMVIWMCFTNTLYISKCVLCWFVWICSIRIST